MEQCIKMDGGGILEVRQQGPVVVLTARRADCRDGLYKVWLLGERRDSCLLGTLIPDGPGFYLQRRVAVRELTAAGCWPVCGARAARVFAFAPAGGWTQEAHPERLLSDACLRRQVCGPMLLRREGEGFRLAAPFRPDRPMPLTGLFCLAQVAQLEGKPHLIWRFGSGGDPLPGGDREEARGSKVDLSRKTP